MERLTIRTNEASISFECESVGDIVRRLAAIEDILGDEYDLNRLRELAQADRDGRCVVMPCRIGDTVWTLLPECGRYFVREVRFSVSMFDHIGEAIFLTRADAEAALRREQEWPKLTQPCK